MPTMYNCKDKKLNMKKKTLFKGVLLIAAIIGAERFCHKMNHGFMVHKIVSHFPYDEAYKLASFDENEVSSLHTILNQEFRFLGYGGQGYSFVSNDTDYVIKFFKMHHMRTPRILEKIPLFSNASLIKDNFVRSRQENHAKIFTSVKIASEQFKDETGIVFANLNPAKNIFPTIAVISPIGVKLTVDLNHVPFVLQKRADLAFTQFKKLAISKEEYKIQKMIDDITSFISIRCKKQIEDTDGGLLRNFSYYNNKIMQIDVGSFRKNDELKEVDAIRNTLLKKTGILRRMLIAHYPEMVPYLDLSIERSLDLE